MIVLDASVGAALALNEQPVADRAWDRLAQASVIVVPALFDLEVMSAIRGHEQAGEIGARRAEAAAEAIADLRLVRWPHTDLRRRIFALRHNLTVYDAAYVALAEALQVPLLTADAKLARAPVDFVDFVLL